VPRRLAYTLTARDDLAGVRRWLTQFGSGPVARRRLSAIRMEIGNLQQHPCLYPFGRHPGVRELSCTGGYRVLYADIECSMRSIPIPDVTERPVMSAYCEYSGSVRTVASSDTLIHLTGRMPAVGVDCPREYTPHICESYKNHQTPPKI
jgi:hypothetical protein